MNIDNMTILSKHHIFRAILLGAILIPWLSSCVKEPGIIDDNPYCDGEEISVPLTLSVTPIESGNSGTRADKTYLEANEDEKKIHDFWIIEYHENGTRAGFPRYFTEKADSTGTLIQTLPTDIKILIPRRNKDKYTCVLIANSNDPDLFSKDNTARYSSLDDLRRFDLPTHNHEHVFDPTHNKYLLMSGWTTITTDPETHHLSFELIRNVCKVNVRLTAFPDQRLVYKYFQWRDVPLGKAFPHGSVDYKQLISRDWRMHEDADPSEQQKRKDLEAGIDFYIPCNIWLPEGPNVSQEPNRKEDATHFTVVAREIVGWREPENEEEQIVADKHIEYNGKMPVESGEQYEFCLYPSQDKEAQFDFRPNHFYKMEMAIKDLNPDDEFVNLIDYKYLEESNCYMVRRDSKELFAVPLSRINKFWGWGGYDPDPDLDSLEDKTEWVAEVIWQDTPERIIDFTSFKAFEVAPDKNRLEGVGWGEYLYENGEPKYDSNGNPIIINGSCFAFRTTGSGVGNVIIGVRKKVPGWENIPVEKREYLWSWHIWVTDYTPDDAPMNSWGDKQVQKVLNGEVYKLFKDFTQVIGEELHEFHFYDWEEDGMTVCIMDRNLGAMEVGALTHPLPFGIGEQANYAKNVVRADGDKKVPQPTGEEIKRRLPSFGLYYQYGRKDPFPFGSVKHQSVYDINGQKIEAFMETEPIPIPDQGEQEKGRVAISATMIISDPTDPNDLGSYPKSINFPYKFYTRTTMEAPWFDESVEEWYTERECSEADTATWFVPDWWFGTDKSIYDPCPPGWKVMDYKHFHHLDADDENDYDIKDGNLKILFDWSVSFNFSRNLGFYIIGPDPDLHAWFPAQGKRFHDTGGSLLFEGFDDEMGHSGIWLDYEYALKSFLLECQISKGQNRESLSAGYPIRCMRDLEYMKNKLMPDSPSDEQ